MAKRTEKGSIEIGCVEQGAPVLLVGLQHAIEWLEAEKSFWSGHSALNGTIVSGQSSYGNVELTRSYHKALDRIISSLKEGAIGPLNDYLRAASEFRVILGQGYVGKNLSQFTQSVNKDNEQAGQQSALMFVTALSLAVTPLSNIPPEMLTIRAMIMLNPMLSAAANVVQAEEARELAAAALKIAEEDRERADLLSRSMRSELEKYKKDTTSTFYNRISSANEALSDQIDQSHQKLLQHEQVFTDKLLLMAPSKHWGAVARSAGFWAMGALTVFVFLLSIPFLYAYAYANWAVVNAFLLEIMTKSADGISLTGLAAITVPVLAYGWLLRHVSRIFVQNLSLQADAAHRRVMAATYLGLARIKAAGVTDQERALVLNALFRSPPPHSADDGPPSGLLDLIKKGP